SAETIRYYDSVAARYLDSFKLLPGEGKGLGEVEQYLKQQQRDGKIVYGSASNEPVTLPPGTKIPQPTYPAEAKTAHVSGDVTVWVVIDEEGKVVAAQIKSGHPLLAPAALEAARAVRLEPTLLEGKPIKVSVLINYNFKLQ
ncbi:MAG: TonB family protein, partial [Acidobacteria bacterium]|nr:TonB family protein [Acidobacteriota bacterium]